MLNFGKKLCCAVCVIALLLTCAAPCIQGFAASDIGLQSGTRNATPQADIYGLRNLIELSDALDLSQVTAPQSTLDAFQEKLEQAKAVEQNGGATAAEITAAYNALAAVYKELTPVIDPEQAFILRSGGLVFYDQISVGLLEDYRNVSQQYQCLAYPYEALIRSVRWSSSNPDITVSADGVVSSLVNSPQYSTITVTVTTYDGREITSNPSLCVCFAKIHVSGLSFDADSMTGYLGETGKINYTLSPQVAGYCTANIQDVIWSSSSAEDVSVDSDGTLHFNKASGPDIPAAAIRATSVDGGRYAECWVYVDYNRKALQAKIEEANRLEESLYTAETWQQMTAVLAQAVAVYEKDFYISSQAEIDNAAAALSAALQALEPLATIDNIVITHDGQAANKYNSVKVGTFASYSAQSFSLGISVTPSDAAYQSVTWSSSDPSINVDQNGTVKPASNNAAAAKVTATVTDYNGRQFSDWVCVSFVKTQATGVSISSSSLSLAAGSSASLTCEVQPKANFIGTGGASIGTVLWESSNPLVATVSDGTVTAVDGGTAAISCITIDGGFTATCSVTVTIDKTELDQALSIARSIGSTSYTEESFAALQEAIEAGNAVYLNENAKIAEVNAAKDAIYDAIDALVVRPADYTELYQLISMFEALSPDLYTPESYAAVQQAVNNVVYGLPYSEQARVDAMAQSISRAMEQLAERLVPHLTPVMGSGAVVDNENHLIYGISPGTEDVLSFLIAIDGTLTFTPAACGVGTGSTVTMVDLYGDAADTFTLIIFGDVDGDGWYDGQDATIVNCIANGLLSREQVGEAKWMAADCNNDGEINASDVFLLEQAGLLLANVDQTKEDYAETDAFEQYLNLIDQNPDADEEPIIEEPTEPDPAPVAKTLIEKIIEVVKTIITFIRGLFPKI